MTKPARASPYAPTAARLERSQWRLSASRNTWPTQISYQEDVMQNLVQFITNSRVWKSFFRHGWPDNPLDRSLVMTTNIFFHLHPVKVNLKSIKATYSLGLGILTAAAFFSLAITGTLLMFY